MIHDTVKRMPGITNGMIASAKNSVLNGVLVRSFIQARPVPMTSDSTAAPVANCKELKKRRALSLLRYALRKFSSVYCAGSVAVCGVRKLCQSRNTSGTRASQTTSATGTPITTNPPPIPGRRRARKQAARPRRSLDGLAYGSESDSSHGRDDDGGRDRHDHDDGRADEHRHDHDDEYADAGGRGAGLR